MFIWLVTGDGHPLLATHAITVFHKVIPQNYIPPDTDIITYADEDGSRAGEGNPED